MQQNLTRPKTAEKAWIYRGSLALLAALGACAAPRTEWAPILSKEAVVLDLPVVEQDELHACGLVSISALCNYWGVSIPVEEQERLAAIAREREGLSGAELSDALARRGFESFLFSGTLDHGPTGLFTQVDAGRPVVVMISPKETTHHYVLFLGYDEPQRAACLLDPVRGRIVVPYETFQKNWAACDSFTLLAIPAPEPRPVVATQLGGFQ